jgi:hypothetical protein
MQSKQGCHWEVVCKNRVELENLVDQQLSSNNRAEKQLIKYITQVLYDVADKAERRRIRKEQAELRRLFPPEVSITPTQLRSRTRGARVNYNIDDAYDFVDEDDEYEEDETRRAETNSPPRPAPTRWSSRLNDTEDSRWKELDEDDEDDEYDEDEVMSTLKSDTTVIDVVNDDDDNLVQEKGQDTADINFSINNTVDREDLMEIADSNSQLTVNSAILD